TCISIHSSLCSTQVSRKRPDFTKKWLSFTLREVAHFYSARNNRSKTFPKLVSPLMLRTARIWHCGYRTLAPVGELGNLEELVIGSLPDSSMEFLCKLSRLRYLRILHMPKITDVAAIERLTNIEVLSLSTSPGWDAAGKCTVVDSLMPLAKLPRLKHLELFGVRPANKSLCDLQRCPALESARFSRYPADETARFYRETGALNVCAPESSFQ
ncbi:leucine-rich repeat domain-containing protein, partial [Pseudoduganella ginsengisoli]|uniref:hypothetical protein n=1 Tax=Pseudoduganella ginsengisoli TaxID=1462440 RepID=UPI001E30D3B7